MKKYYVIVPLVMMALMLIALPQGASAHETRMYEIKHQLYTFVVGSLNEPIAVDDKTGVHLMVTRPAVMGYEEGADHHETAGAVAGLDKTLKVEISAGDKKKVLELAPIHGEAGAYRASFIPTVQTTYTYRFFGTVNNTPVDVVFTCNPVGHPVTEEDKKEIEISEGVHQILKRGAFGCPVAKTDLGFPETAMSGYELAQKLEDSVAQAGSAKRTAMVGIVIGVLGLVAGAGAFFRPRG
ncbi:MAG: hypothetical protein Q8R30_05440 [bacterium]|nr:hypothetical protein [bacterium]MDZ4285817.1 hypothetical protein [Candidatus Sungbacteria bacterium]